VFFQEIKGGSLSFHYQPDCNLPMAPPPSFHSEDKTLGNFSYEEQTHGCLSLSLHKDSIQILSMRQKELLLWHNRLGNVNMKLIQGLYQETLLQKNYHRSKSCVLSLCAARNPSKMCRCSSAMFPRPKKFMVFDTRFIEAW